MRKIKLIISGVCLLSLFFMNINKVNAQSTVNYTFGNSTTGSLTNMTGATALITPASATADYASAVTNIGFDFWLQGARYTQFSVNSNGVLRLGGTAVSTTYLNNFATGGTGGAVAGDYPALIAPFWEDMNQVVGTTSIRYLVTGSAPNRVLNVEWSSMLIPFNATGSANTSTFQAHLYETTGVVEYAYGAMNIAIATTVTATIGFANAASTTNSMIYLTSLSTPAVSRTTPSTNTLVNSNTVGAIANLNSAADGSRVMYSFTPPTTVAPTALNFTAVTQGGMTLNWTASSPITNILKYAIYYSTDNVNFTFLSTVPVGTNTYAASGLPTAGITYYWQVCAVSEGYVSAAATGSQATLSPTLYYSKSAGSLNTLATWGTNTDGTGTAPLNFTSGYCTYNIVNNAAPTIAAAWTVSGTGSKIIVGDGGTSINFTIPGASALTTTAPVVIDVTAGSILTITNTTVPSLGTLNATSTVNYNGAGAQTISAKAYGNLGYTGSSTGTFAGTATAAGNYNQTGGTVLLNNGATSNNLTITGNFSMSGTSQFNQQNGTTSLGSTITVNGATGTTLAGTALLLLDNGASPVANVSIFQTTNLVATSTTAGMINWGAQSSRKANEFRISGDFTKSGTGTFTNGGGWLYPFGGFVFNGTGATQTLNYTGTNSDGIPYTINSGAYVKLAANFSLTANNYNGSASAGPAVFTVNGTLDCSTFTLSAANAGATDAGSFQQFILNSGATLVTANANGIYNSPTNTASISGALYSQFASDANYIFNGIVNQTTNFKFTPSRANNIQINNTTVNGTVTLNNGGVAVSGTLTLTQGRFVSTAADLLSITNTDPGAVTGGASSPAAFVEGPMKWSIDAGADFVFPVGQGTGANNYLRFTLSPSVAGSPVVTVQATSGASGGTGDAAGFSSISGAAWWQGTLNSGSFTGTVSLQRPTALTTESSIGQSTTQAGTYFNIGGTAVTGPPGKINTSNNITGFSAGGYFVMGTGIKTYNIASSNSFTGAASYCKSAVSSALSAVFNTCTVGSGAATPTTVTVKWYWNPTNSTNTVGANLVQTTTLVTTGSLSTKTFPYTPLTTIAEVGARYYFAVLSVPSNSGCGFAAVATLTSGSGGVDGTQLVTVYDNPTTATVGGPQSICASNTSGSLGGNTPVIGTGAWSVTGVPGGGSAGDITFSNAASGSSTATAALNAVTGVYTLTWTISNGACAASTANFTLTVTTKPTITLGNNTVAPASICATGGTKVPIQSFTLAVTNCDGNLTDLAFTTAGTYTDVDVTRFQLWYGTTTLASATQVGADITSGLGAGTHMVGPFASPTLTAGTTYTFWITMDVDPAATNGVTISTSAVASADLTTLSNPAGGPTTAGGLQTIKGQPTALAGGSTTVCQTTASYTLGAGEAAASNGVISWAVTTGNGSITGGGTTVTPTYTLGVGDAGTTVVLTMTVTNAPCSVATAIYSIIVNRSPTANTTGTGTQTICPNTNFTLGTGGNTATATNGVIVWTHDGAGFITNGDTNTPTYHSATGDGGNTVTLTMTVTSDNACNPATASATYALAVSTIVTPTIGAGGATSFCRGGSVVLTASGGTPGGYTWSTGEVTDAITVSTSQAITVSIPIDGNGCFPPPSAVTNVRQWAPPTGVVTGSNVYCTGGTSLLSATSSGSGSGSIASYQWQISTDGGATWSNIGGATASTYTASGPSADYRVFVTNSNGCSVVWCP